MDKKCKNCSRWEAYARKEGKVWFGYCASRDASTCSEHGCHRFREKEVKHGKGF